MTEKEMAESMVRGLGKEIGFTVPAELAVEVGAVLLAKLGGRSWDDAVAAGKAARASIVTETDAERSRRERMGEPT